MTNKGMIYLDEYYHLNFQEQELLAMNFATSKVLSELLSRDEDGFEDMQYLNNNFI